MTGIFQWRPQYLIKQQQHPLSLNQYQIFQPIKFNASTNLFQPVTREKF